MSTRLLFVLSRLPRGAVSLPALVRGEEAVSGSVSCSLLVADGLAERGHEVGMVVLDGQRVTGSRVRTFDDLGAALAWQGRSGPVLWCSWGDVGTADVLNAAGVRPWLWSHVHVSPRWLRHLEQGRLEGIITVSDVARLALLRSSAARRIGRVYNPLHPFFAAPDSGTAARYSSAAVVFTGHLGTTTGAHRVLAAWPDVRQRLPHATLTIVGSAKLYGADRAVGPLGIAAPKFETEHLLPLAERFGSLDAAGIRLAGLLAPSELRDLYQRSALGLVNFNWDASTETFCCTAVEMLATGLPVLSFARGGLPETIGRTGGAELLTGPDLRHAAAAVADLLQAPARLEAMGAQGAGAVHDAYRVDRILDRWEVLLSTDASDLDRATGAWQYRRDLRYLLERSAGRLGAGRGLALGIAAARRVLRR